MGSTIDVLEFWFGDAARRLWFATDPAFDEAIRVRFGPLLTAAASGQIDHWSSDADGALALTIVLDQFTRNAHRGSARAFENDARARRVADGAIESQLDRVVPLDRRRFFYMPFQHSESLVDQERSIDLFSRWVSEHRGDARACAEEEMSYARRHHEIIRRFGRFPHRNAMLGRVSTPAELAFLTEPNSSF